MSEREAQPLGSSATTPSPSLDTESTLDSLESEVWFRRIVFWSVASAIGSLVPVPLLDDHLVRISRRRMVREVLATHGHRLDDAWIRYLSGTQSGSALGCFVATAIALALKVVYKLLRRVFRTIFFWLAIKDASDAASRTFHEGYLLYAGLAETPGTPPSRQQLEALRDDVEEVCRQVDTRPLQKAVRSGLRGTWRLLRSAGRRLGRRDRRIGVAAETQILEETVPQPVVERIVGVLSSQRRYLSGVHRTWKHVRKQRWHHKNASQPPDTQI